MPETYPSKATLSERFAPLTPVRVRPELAAFHQPSLVGCTQNGRTALSMNRHRRSSQTDVFRVRRFRT